MLNRRLLRIKVLQAIYSYDQDGSGERKAKETFLLNSVKKVEDEYLFLLMLPLELRYYVENEQNPESLYVPTKKDIDTGRTFIYNKLITQLDYSEPLRKKYKNTGLNWHNHKDVMRLVYNGFKTSKYFQQYLDAPDKNYEVQKRLLLHFYKEFLPGHEEMNNLMEELLIHWNDDNKVVYNALQKTIEGMKEDQKEPELATLGPDFDDDWQFCQTLFHRTIDNKDEYILLISEKTKKWDAERIAEIDLILMRMAICEMMEFPTIPIKVSINEYLDISKIYSTPKSSTFLNGILDKIMNELKGTGLIKKSGRGLVE